MAIADEPDEDPDDGGSRQALTEEHATEDRDAQRHQGDEQRGDPRWDRLFADRDKPHAATHQQGADDRGVAVLPP